MRKQMICRIRKVATTGVIAEEKCCDRISQCHKVPVCSRALRIVGPRFEEIS